MGKQKIPAHVLSNSKTASAREWKSLKRKQARIARKAIDDLRCGCAYFPLGGHDVQEADEAIDRIIEEISVKSWGQ